MARPPSGSIVVNRGKRGTTYAARFRVNGKREYQTLEVASMDEANEALKTILAEVRLGIWRPTAPAVAEPDEDEETFHQFASNWLEAKRPELMPRTCDDYKWSLTYHLLPFFKNHRLSEITVREVDRYKALKLAEGVLSPNTLNKTLTRLAQILGDAVDYNLIAANPAVGKKRRANSTKPRRPWVEPEQLITLLQAAEAVKSANREEQKVALLGGRGRPLLATLAGAGLRIDEALSLQRQHVNVAKGTLTVVASKTEAGIRTVELPPALRDELATYLDGSKFKKPTDLVFPTGRGKKDNRQNVRQRLFMKAIERANVKLAEKKLEPLGDVRPHGLRRTYASLRMACGDDPVYVSRQIGHTDVRFTLNCYAQAVKRRERMSEAEKAEYDRAIDWASWASEGPSLGSTAQSTDVQELAAIASGHEKSPV
jgi:integrase